MEKEPKPTIKKNIETKLRNAPNGFIQTRQILAKLWFRLHDYCPYLVLICIVERCTCSFEKVCMILHVFVGLRAVIMELNCCKSAHIKWFVMYILLLHGMHKLVAVVCHIEFRNVNVCAAVVVVAVVAVAIFSGCISLYPCSAHRLFVYTFTLIRSVRWNMQNLRFMHEKYTHCRLFGLFVSVFFLGSAYKRANIRMYLSSHHQRTHTHRPRKRHTFFTWLHAFPTSSNGKMAFYCRIFCVWLYQWHLK